VCIGQHFAIAEAILALASIVSRFGLTAPTGQIITPSAWITLRPKQPVMLQLSERETPSQHESLNRQKDKVADPLATSHSPSHL
jgi:hypothetical protein